MAIRDLMLPLCASIGRGGCCPDEVLCAKVTDGVAGTTARVTVADMGLLDELEQEAQRRKASLGDVERAKVEREEAFRTRLDPGLQAFHEYLARLTANLVFLKPKIQVRFELPGYGGVVADVEHEYELRANSPSALSREVVLRMSAVVATDECPVVEVSGAARIRTLNGFFQKVRLAGISETKKDESGELVQATFRARGKVALCVAAAADGDSGVARLSFTNLDGFGTIAKTVSAQQFDEKLFDEVGRFVTGEPNSLFREPLPEDFRKQLATRVQQEQLKRKWESKIFQQAPEAERAQRDAGLKVKLDRVVKDVADKTPAIIDKVKGLFNRKS